MFKLSKICIYNVKIQHMYPVCTDVEDGVKREYVPVPIPVPVFIPVPMNMYSQVTPTPVSLPVPVRRYGSCGL